MSVVLNCKFFSVTFLRAFMTQYEFFKIAQNFLEVNLSSLSISRQLTVEIR